MNAKSFLGFGLQKNKNMSTAVYKLVTSTVFMYVLFFSVFSRWLLWFQNYHLPGIYRMSYQHIQLHFWLLLMAHRLLFRYTSLRLECITVLTRFLPLFAIYRNSIVATESKSADFWAVGLCINVHFWSTLISFLAKN